MAARRQLFKSFLAAAVALPIGLAAPASAADGTADASSAEAAKPPLVPHTIAGYKISRDLNECLACHQPPGAAQAGAPQMTDAHYVYRQGVRLDKILATRFLCNQCHMASPDAKPLPPGAGGRP